MSSHKVLHGGLLLDVITLYRFFCFFTLFPVVGKGLREAENVQSITPHFKPIYEVYGRPWQQAPSLVGKEHSQCVVLTCAYSWSLHREATRILNILTLSNREYIISGHLLLPIVSYSYWLAGFHCVNCPSQDCLAKQSNSHAWHSGWHPTATTASLHLHGQGSWSHS